MIRLFWVLILNIFHLVSFALRLPFYALGRLLGPKARWVRVPLQGGVPMTGTGGLGRWFQEAPTFLQLRRNFKALAEDRSVEGILIELDNFHVDDALRHEIGGWLGTLRAAGKHVAVHAESYSTPEYALATHADRVALPPPGRLFTFKPRMELYFGNAALQRLGIHPQFLHIGRFKSVMNQFTRSESSAAQREMMGELLRGLTESVVEATRALRPQTNDSAIDVFNSAPLSAPRAQAHGFIDAQVYRADLAHWVTQRDAPLTHYLDHLDGKLRLKWRRFRPRARIAFVDLSGVIVTPDVSVPTANAVIDSSVVIPLLRRLRESRQVHAVVLHIDSPGGSAIASDLIWREVASLRHEKPVVAWCSNTVASGGYYIAVGADEIVCGESTMIGSIGVITGKASAAQAAERLGIGIETLGDADTSLLSVTQPLDGAGLENLRRDTRDFYTRFLTCVGRARKIPPRRLHRFARGRVYLGPQAVARGLADHLGGFDLALNRAAELADLSPDDVALVAYSHRRSSLKEALRSSILSVASTRVQDELVQASLLRHGGVLAWEPLRIRWR